MPDALHPARAELAPTGELRAGMNLGNALFTGKDPATGELRGVSVDVMGEVGRRLGVPVRFVMYATPGEVADAAGANAWDAAILAIEPARAEWIAFSGPMTEIEATYLVKEDSPLRVVGEVDAPGVRIAAPAKAGYELYLTRTLRHATLVRTKAGEQLETFLAQGLDAVAGLKPNLLRDLQKVAGLRLVEGRFTAVQHGIGVPVGRSAAAAYVRQVVEDLNASGFVARAIERHAVEGLSPLSR